MWEHHPVSISKVPLFTHTVSCCGLSWWCAGEDWGCCSVGLGPKVWRLQWPSCNHKAIPYPTPTRRSNIWKSKIKGVRMGWDSGTQATKQWVLQCLWNTKVQLHRCTLNRWPMGQPAQQLETTPSPSPNLFLQGFCSWSSGLVSPPEGRKGLCWMWAFPIRAAALLKVMQVLLSVYSYPSLKLGGCPAVHMVFWAEGCAVEGSLWSLCSRNAL